MNIYNINGTFVPANDSVLDIHDLAILRGYGVFDFLRTYKGVPFHLKDHLLRLKKSARLMGLSLDVSLEELEQRVMKTLVKNNHKESNIRIVATGGVSDDNLMPADKTQLIIMVTPVKQLPASYYTDGVKIITSQTERYLPGAKTNNYIPAIMMLKEAKSRQAIEAIYTSKEGYLLEGTTSNFFAIIGGRLVTPPENRILPGITRQVIIKLAKKATSCEVRDIHKEEIRLMDEAFITASNKEIIPVISIDDIAVGNGTPGKKTKKVMKQFRKYTKEFRN